MYQPETKNQSIKTVALVDPFFGGHHLMYMRYFTKTLLELGYTVVVLFPRPKKVFDWVERNVEYDHTKLILVPFEDRFRLTAKRKITVIAENMMITMKRWKSLTNLLAQTEDQNKIKINFVFIGWLDSYLFKFTAWYISGLIKYPWSGLYFHPSIRLERRKRMNFLSNDSLINTRNCKGVALLDRNIVNLAGKRFPGKKIYVFPDFSYVEPLVSVDKEPETNYALVPEIKAKSNGRLVVGLIGLAKRKGTLIMVRMAKLASIQEYFFVFCGKVTREYYSDSEWSEIDNFFANLPANCYLYQGHISEERYISLIECFDIVFAIYKDFHSSSNMLTKAAIHKRPVLSTNRFYMGEVVNEFKLGVTVDEDSIDSCMEGLSKLGNMIRDNSFDFSGFDRYAEQNDPKLLKNAFLEILDI